MVDKEKKRFHEMAEKDKQRYEAEMQNYVPPKGAVVGRGKKRKQIKDPNAPKRSLWVRSKMNYHINLSLNIVYLVVKNNTTISDTFMFFFFL